MNWEIISLDGYTIINHQPWFWTTMFFLEQLPFFEDIEKTNTITKLSRLIFQIPYISLLAMIFGISSLRFRAFGIFFFIFTLLSFLHDIQLILEDNLGRRKLSILDRIMKWFSERKRNAFRGDITKLDKMN